VSSFELIKIHDSMQRHDFGTICVPINEILRIAFHLENNDNDNMEVVNVKLTFVDALLHIAGFLAVIVQ
jgi:hypothetical protein